MMKMVINIPEWLYKELKDSGQFAVVRNRAEIFWAIFNGKPLPKGHGRLVDADAVLEDPFGNTYKDLDIAETIIEADNVESED